MQHSLMNLLLSLVLIGDYNSDLVFSRHRSTSAGTFMKRFQVEGAVRFDDAGRSHRWIGDQGCFDKAPRQGLDVAAGEFDSSAHGMRLRTASATTENAKEPNRDGNEADRPRS